MLSYTLPLNNMYSGAGVGGLYGFQEGLRKAPSNKWRVKLNSVLNHGGKRAAKVGNATASLAVLYSISDLIFDKTGVQKLLQIHDTVPSIVAGFTGGLIFKSTKGPVPMLISGFIGASFGLLSYLYHTTPNLF